MARRTRVKPSIIYQSGLAAPFTEVRESLLPAGFYSRTLKRHPGYVVIYEKSGRGELQTDRFFFIDPGQVIILPPGTAFGWKNTSDKPLELITLYLQKDLKGFAEIKNYLHALCTAGPGLGMNPGVPELAGLFDKIKPEIKKGEWGYRQYASALLTEYLLTAIRPGIKALEKDKSAGPMIPRLEKALWFMEANYAKKITLKDISQSMKLSVRHTCDLFAKELKIAPIHYLQKIRVEKARVLLEETGKKVKEIAHAVGFDDEHYFSQLFKKMTGLPPQHYRKK